MNERTVERTGRGKKAEGGLANSDLAGQSLISGTDCNNETGQGFSRQNSSTVCAFEQSGN